MYDDSVRLIADKVKFSNKNILITGATGLIGVALTDVLVKANQIYGFNNVIYALGRSEERIIKKFGNNVVPIIQDIAQPLKNEHDFDFIVHLASNADPRSYALYPVETIMTNISGCKNTLDYCRDNKKCRLLFTSSFEVYGKIPGKDEYEEAVSGIIDQTVLRNGYAESKRCAELLVRSYVDEYKVDSVVARLPSVYGPTMQETDSKAQAQFIRNACNDEDIVLKSKGEQIRSYCYVLDVVSAMLFLLTEGQTGQIYNVSNEQSTASIADVAKVCASVAGRKVVYELPDETEKKGFSVPQNCILDNRKIRNLGWKGFFSLEEGIRETINFLKEK